MIRELKELSEEAELRKKAKVETPGEDQKERGFQNEKHRVNDPEVLRSYEGQFCTLCKNLLGPERVVMRVNGQNLRAHYHKTCAAKVLKQQKDIEAKVGPMPEKFFSCQPEFNPRQDDIIDKIKIKRPSLHPRGNENPYAKTDDTDPVDPKG